MLFFYLQGLLLFLDGTIPQLCISKLLLIKMKTGRNLNFTCKLLTLDRVKHPEQTSKGTFNLFVWLRWAHPLTSVLAINLIHGEASWLDCQSASGVISSGLLKYLLSWRWRKAITSHCWWHREMLPYLLLRRVRLTTPTVLSNPNLDWSSENQGSSFMHLPGSIVSASHHSLAFIGNAGLLQSMCTRNFWLLTEMRKLWIALLYF